MTQLPIFSTHQSDLEVCNTCRCGFCRDGCPWFKEKKIESASPKGVTEVILAYRDGLVEPSQQLLDRLAGCYGCRYCTSVCPPSNVAERFDSTVDVAELVSVTRADLVSKGFTLGKAAELAMEKTRTHGNPIGSSAKERASWAQGLDLPREQETVFFASCMNPLMGYGETALKMASSGEKVGLNLERMASITSVVDKLKLGGALRGLVGRVTKDNEKYTKSLRNAVHVLEKLEVPFGYMGEDEPCCGSPFHTYGRYDLFEEHVKKTYRQLKDAGVKKLITLNPICAGVMKTHYPKYVKDFDIEVFHFVEVVAKELESSDRQLRLGNELDVVWHDPCYLSRYVGASDKVRSVLGRIEGLKVREPERTGVNTCCAGCGGVEVTVPEQAKSTALDRYEQLLATGATKIATSCPSCVMMMKTASHAAGDDTDVLEISDIVYEAMKDS